jgi:uncharacterized protein (DUF2236 family)
MTRSVLPRLFLWPLETHLDQMTVRLLRTPGSREVDFSKPVGEPALVGVDSVSWRIFKNPVSVFVGGIAAVILELAEPSVRSGVWEHSSFRTNPVRRLQRTGMAAMMTVYGPRNAAEKMIAGVVRRHDTVSGTTPDGEAYHASDRELLDWVQATAAFGFAEAYNRYVHPLGEEGLSQVFAEGADAARLYGAAGAPVSWGGWKELLKSKRDRLEPSPIVFEFLDIMADAPVLPPALRPLQRLIIRGAVEMTPPWVRERVGLSKRYGLGTAEEALLRQAGKLVDAIVLRSSPAVQACRRLGLPPDYLYGPKAANSYKAA